MLNNSSYLLADVNKDMNINSADALRRIFFSCLMNNYYGIITFTNKNFLKNGIHTFFLFYDKNNKEYVVFNGYDAKITSAKRYKNISDISKNGGSSYFYGILFKK